METALSDTSVENRRSERIDIRVPVKLEVRDRTTATIQTILGYTSNINRHGLRLHIGSDFPLINNSQVIIHIDGLRHNFPTKVDAKLLWHTNSQCGVHFNKEFIDIQELLQSLSSTFNAAPAFLKTFFAYVNDEDIDTKKYEFFPYADKIITDYKKTREYLLQFKRGQSPVGAETYIYAQYAVADESLNKLAIESAHKAFRDFKNFPISSRRRILDDIRDLLVKEKQNLIDLMVIEGHPRKLAEWEYSGMLVAISQESLDYFEKEMLQTVGRIGTESIMYVRRPNGVVCVSPPRNASSVAFMACLALLAGNTLVVKPPLQMPISSVYMWRNIFGRVLKANNAPKGTVNIVVGNSRLFMQEWLANPQVSCIFFFGDSNNGLEMGNQIFANGKKPLLELSGNDFLVVWKDAPLEQATDALLDAFMGSTQICMVPKKALIHEDIYPQFMKLFLEKVKKLKVGLPSDPETILAPVGKITEYYEHLQDALQKGAELLIGGYRLNYKGERDEEGVYISPSVLDVPLKHASTMKCIVEENFFPLLPVIKITAPGVSSREKDAEIFQKMMGVLEQNQYGLRISVWVREPLYLRKFIEDVHYSGLLRLNSRHINFSPYLSTNGGIGKSGGPYGEMNHVWHKTSHLQGISVTRLDIDPVI